VRLAGTAFPLLTIAEFLQRQFSRGSSGLASKLPTKLVRDSAPNIIYLI
jgi:hypothetical protein